MMVSLRLITDEDLRTPSSIRMLRDWRIKNKHAYHGDYKVTYNSILEWLENYVLVPGRYLYFIVADGEFVGHIGVKNIKRSSIEIDNVARGLDKPKGVMHEALQMLVNAYPDKKIWLRVLADNEHAIRFYIRNGFVITELGEPFVVMQYEK